MSRPNVAPSSKSGALAAETSAPSIPNVVIGVSTPPPSTVSEAPPSNAPASEPPIAHAEAAVQLELPVTPIAPAVRDTLVAPAMTDADDDEEPASEQRVRVAEKVEEEKVANLSDTIVDAKKPEAIEEPKVEAKTEEPRVEAKEAKKEALPDAVPQDEETIPPAGDLAVAEQFFSEGEVARHAAADDDDLDDIALDKAQRKSDPAVVQRRAKLARYVTWAVGVSAALCLIAVVRTTFSTSSKTITAANAASAKSEIVVPKASPPPAVVEAPKAVQPEPAAPAPAEPAKPVLTGDAKEEKAKSKAALNKGKLADAIEAGEKSVALDETDSEAWLLLGAAYQEKGQLADAQKAYKSCLEKGTKDRFQRECRLFVR